jgi:hypothetical protein
MRPPLGHSTRLASETGNLAASLAPRPSRLDAVDDEHPLDPPAEEEDAHEGHEVGEDDGDQSYRRGQRPVLTPPDGGQEIRDARAAHGSLTVRGTLPRII